MTKNEAAIVMAFTGKMLGNFDDFHAYAENLLNKPIFTHELPEYASKIKSLAKADFINLAVK